MPAWKVRQILEDDQDAEIYGSQLPQFGVDAGDGIRYDLIRLDEEEPVNAIGVYDVDEGEALDFYDIDDIVEEWEQ